MTETDQPSLSESEKLAATLAALEAEREQRRVQGKWSRGTLPTLMAAPQASETLRAAQQRAVYEHLAKHPDAPKNVSAYEWMELEVVIPEPTVEPPATQYTPDHADASDVTPSRPPMPPPSPPPAPRDEPLTYSNAGIPRREHERELRRAQRFHDGEWGDPGSYPIRYPWGRGGW
jgi:hypothetical protein